jgi:hypothetical protein
MTLNNNKKYINKIKNRILVSKEVIKDSQLDNGSIVEANSTKEYYPPTAKNYFYVWPRDASYACIAADIVGIDDVQSCCRSGDRRQAGVKSFRSYLLQELEQMLSQLFHFTY